MQRGLRPRGALWQVGNVKLRRLQLGQQIDAKICGHDGNDEGGDCREMMAAEVALPIVTLRLAIMAVRGSAPRMMMSGITDVHCMSRVVGSGLVMLCLVRGAQQRHEGSGNRLQRQDAEQQCEKRSFQG